MEGPTLVEADEVNPGELLSLHRRWIWADRMRLHFDAVLAETGMAAADLDAPEAFDPFMYLSMWYGLLFVVVEGWRRLGLNHEEVDGLLEHADHVRMLKRFRHGVFHYHPRYWDEKFVEFMAGGDATSVWVRELHHAFGAALRSSGAATVNGNGET